ncbi:O-antigen ligase domain-containing protein [Methylobacterium sp. NI91]|nr:MULTISPECIES: O-antigen ligase family protein [unclassified Methylobacterium]QIJ77208.1 O-antigen ligase domain-containing protein [Methylobacterium sp. CLZ]QIJ82112.1 O-antigen ligase domain-containing protein [Methylobacterium sp. NI91]
MLNILLVVAVVVWFALLYPLARHRLETRMGPLDGPVAVPFALMSVFALLPLVFNVPREDGNAVLDQGLTASNIALVVMTGLAGLYLAVRVAVDRRVLLVAFSMPYLPFTLMILVNGVSTAWSVVPSYTAYRTLELAIFTLVSILIFDRSDIERRLANLFALFTCVWLVATAPIILDNLAHGIVFSSAKHNLMPYLCAAHAFLVIFDGRIRHRGAHLALALAGFVIAGSAASTASLIAVVPGLMVASRHRRLRLLGYTAFTVYLVLFVVLMVGLSAFPSLLEVVSVVLQKPPEELADATGRGTFWPVFIEATKDRFVGAGYAAGDRFIQLLIPTTALAETLARDAVFISSSHNMLLSAWAGTGLIGIGLCAMVLGAALRWGMKLDRAGRRLIATCVFFLILNGMTTPGIFQDWNINVLTFVALLAYARIGALHREPAGAAAPAPEAAPLDLRRAAAA